MIRYMKQHFFGRLAVLFVLAASILVVLTYSVVYWGLEDKDNILDAHDAYYHYKFIETWGSFSDTTSIHKELDNLRMVGAIYSINADTLCSDDYIWNPDHEKKLIYWTNGLHDFSLCDYISYQGSSSASNNFRSISSIKLHYEFSCTIIIAHKPYFFCIRVIFKFYSSIFTVI